MDSQTDVTCCATFAIGGVVQGVGFRPFVARLAREHNLTGQVRNEGGLVTIQAWGLLSALSAFADALQEQAPVASQILSFKKQLVPVGPADRMPAVFTIVESRTALGSINPAPDLAICEDCARELFTPGDRRYRNPFISCTNCGPRYTIMHRMPYDRVSTTMERYPLCPVCAAQYADPVDRRYHAQTVCCNHCGPVLQWYTAKQASAGDALQSAITSLKNGEVIAIKGIGGYHLACDARNAASVAKLRTLKGRDSKPFAVMFQDMATLLKHCEATAAEQSLLSSSARPITLLRRKSQSSITPSVYSTSAYTGAFLPYTPLQMLLLAQIPALVMTSANESGVPIIIEDAAMFAFSDANIALGGVLWHDREILRRLDDSVVAIVDGQPLFLRRARGYVPLAIPVAAPSEATILACGAQQKNTVCISQNANLYLSGENGDLDTLESFQSFGDTINDMQQMFHLTPTMVVCDMHPAYESTRYAGETGLPLLPVQHHYAHIASVMAEHAISESVIGVAFDGTGYGPDGTVWGGEFLIASTGSYQRAAHIKAVRFAGSDESVKQGWKSAACMMHDAGLLSASVDPRHTLLAAALDSNVNVIRSSSMGRVFDAISALLGICEVSGYEGQCAIELENAATHAVSDPDEPPLPYAVTHDGQCLVVDFAPCIRELLALKAADDDVHWLALRFHSTVCHVIVDVCTRLRATYDISTVVLSGGVFLNRILLKQTRRALLRSGFTVLTNHLVPAGDGGISLGQAYLGHTHPLTKGGTSTCVSP